MPDKNKKAGKQKATGKGGSKTAVPAKTGDNKHTPPPQVITEQKEIGIGVPVTGKEMEELKEKARKLDR